MALKNVPIRNLNITQTREPEHQKCDKNLLLLAQEGKHFALFDTHTCMHSSIAHKFMRLCGSIRVLLKERARTFVVFIMVLTATAPVVRHPNDLPNVGLAHTLRYHQVYA